MAVTVGIKCHDLTGKASAKSPKCTSKCGPSEMFLLLLSSSPLFVLRGVHKTLIKVRRNIWEGAIHHHQKVI